MKKVEKLLEQNVQQQQPINNNPLQIYINQIIELNEKPESESDINNNIIAITAFQQYISSKFRQLYPINEGKTFLNDVFVSISLHALHNNSKLFLIFASALIRADIGDKYFKANRIAKDLNNITPFEINDNKSWETLEKLLLWLKKHLGTSMNVTVNILKDKLLQWFVPTDLKSYLSSLHILNLLLRQFPISITSILSDAEKIIIESIQSNEEIVRDLGCRTLESALSIEDSPFHYMCISISQLLFSETNYPSEGLINAVYSVIKSAPSISTLFTFAEPPLKRLVQDQSVNNFQLLVLAYRITPSLFTDEDLNKMLSLFLNFVQKKNIRKIALTTLGEIAFMGFVRLQKDHSEMVKKFISLLYPKSLNCEEAGFALLSLISPMNREFSEQLIAILSLPLTKLLLEGLQKFVSNYPVMAPTIRKRMIPLITPILCDDINKRQVLMINTLETMLFTKYVKDEISLGILTQYSRLLSVDNLLLNEKIADLLLYFQDDFPILRFRLLSFISCSTFDELRLTVLRRLNYSHELCYIFKSLLNDRNPKLALETIRVLCEHMEEETIRDFLNDSIQRFPIYDSTRYRHLVKMYLLIAHKFLCLFEPICSVVFDNFFKIEFHFPSSLELLSLLIRLNSTYCDERIIRILEDHLKLHSTIMILRSSLDLLLSVIHHTSIPLSKQLLNQLFDVSRYAEDKELQLRLYIVFSFLSDIIADRVEHKRHNLILKSEQFGAIPLIYSLGSADPLTSLTYASVAVSLNLLFEIVADDSLASLHSSALEALIRILKNFRHIGDDLSEILVQKLRMFLSNSIPSTVSLFLNNFSLFAMVFGDKMKSIIPHVIDLICNHWGVLDISLLLRVTEWIIMTFQSVFKPYIFKVTTLFVSDLFARSPETVNLIFSTLVSYGPLIKEVHSLVIPSFLEWINNVSANIDFNIFNDILMKLKSILLNLEDNTYGLAVLRTLSYALHRLPNNQDDKRIMDLFCLIVLQMKSEFLLFYPEFAAIIKKHETEKLAKIIECLSRKVPIPRTITTLYRPSYAEKPRPQTMATFNVSFDVLNYELPNFTLPPKTILSEITKEEEEYEEEMIEELNKSNDYDEEELNSNESELYSLEETRPRHKTAKRNKKTVSVSKPNKIIAEHEAINRSSACFSFNRKDQFEEFSTESWEQWIDNTASLFIQSSPSIAISASSAVSDKHNHMKMSLFPLALALSVAMSRSNPIWSELFKRIFTSFNIPPLIVRLFLSAIEFLEIVHIDPLPVSYELLATSAMNSGMTVMALRYTELNFLVNPVKFSEQLIRLNQKLGMTMSANGVLRYLKNEAFTTTNKILKPKSNCSFKNISSFSSSSSISFHGGGLIQLLGYWEDALVDLDSKIATKPTDSTLLENKMYCLYQLSRFKDLQAISENRSPIFSAIAAWNNLNIDKFKEEFEKIPKESLDNYALDITPQNLIFIYYEIIYCTLNGEYEKAKSLIELTRRHYSSNLFPLLWDNEERATPIIWDGTLLCEIEEIIRIFELKEKSNKTDFSYIPFNLAINSFKDPEITELQISKENLTHIWDKRVDFACSRKDQKTFYNLILLRSLVLRKEKLNDLWKRFVRSTQSSGLTEMAINALDQIGEQEYGKYLEIKTLYKTDPNKAISQIREQFEILRDHAKLVKNEEEKRSVDAKLFYLSKTLSKWLVKADRLREAEAFLKDAFSDSFFISDSVDDWKIYFLFSKCCSSPYYSFESLLQCVKKNPTQALKFTPKIFSLLFSSRSDRNDLLIIQDTELDENEKEEIVKSFRRNYCKTSPKVWLFHLPQIISMLGNEYNDLMEELLLYIATEHLQDVAHSVVSESRNGKKNCEDIINNLRSKHPVIINNLILFTGELIRIASTWYEIFNTWLDEASRKYIVESERDKFEKLLKKIQNFFSQEATSLIDLQFKTEYGQIISQTEDLYKIYLETKEEFYIHEIWQLYVEIFKKLRLTIEKFNSFDVSDVSSTISNLKNSELTVPFCPDDVHISCIVDKITIINSKQKPRKIGIVGSNGKTYSFLLKANEDTRLDERIMQFFTLYNSLIEVDMPLLYQNRKEKFSDKKRLTISTYGIRPLSNNVGLIGWVSGCTTLFDVLKKNRDRWNIDVNAELQVTMNIAPNFERLQGEKRYVAFVAGLQVTSGDDIKETLVANALDASHWNLRRKVYTASLASTSMVGYVIGLGDRHFGNIMMKTLSAKLVHIDFGDSFEVTKHRKTFPEVVPFRLTRVMVKALEAAGVEGSFRELCQLIMRTMIANREMILGVLETFVQDPILVDRNKTDPKQVLARIGEKLNCVDFGALYPMPVEKQVDILIKEAQDLNNLCQMFIGWRPWW